MTRGGGEKKEGEKKKKREETIEIDVCTPSAPELPPTLCGEWRGKKKGSGAGSPHKLA